MARRASAAELGEALIHASERNMIVEICRLLTAGADVNYVAIKTMSGGKQMSTTALIQAAWNGHADAVRVLISRGAELNKPKPCNDRTALHLVAQEGNVAVIELLMSKGARHDVRDKDGQTPLNLAAFGGQKEAVECLLTHGADVNAKDVIGQTSLLHAAYKGHKEAAISLLDHGADVNARDSRGFTPLIGAAQQGLLPVVGLLVLELISIWPTSTVPPL